MKNGKLLDTLPLVRFFKDEPGAAQIERLLTDSRQGRLRLFISDINAGELYYVIAKQAGTERAERAISSLELFRIERVPTTWELVLAAARLKAEFPLSYADCFAAACAQAKGMGLVTGDREFKRIEHLVSIEWV